MLISFRHPAYRWLWFSNLSGSAGRWALVLVLSAQLLQLTHSSFWVGLGLFLTQGPVILLAPYSGALADRFDRRWLNVLAASLSAVTTGLFAVLTALGRLSLPLTLALSLLFGFSFVFQMTLRSTWSPAWFRPRAFSTPFRSSRSEPRAPSSWDRRSRRPSWSGADRQRPGPSVRSCTRSRPASASSSARLAPGGGRARAGIGSAPRSRTCERGRWPGRPSVRSPCTAR